MSWQALTVRLKQEIVELLDYESRCNLRVCSKSDKETVDSIKTSANNLRILEIPSEMSAGKTIIRLDIDSFTIWFIGREDVTRIDRGWNGDIIDEFSEVKQKNRYEVIGEFMNRLSQKGFMKAETVEVDAIMFPVPETWNIKCNNLKLSNIPNEHYMGWLRKVVTLCQNKFKKLEVRCWGNEAEISTLIAETRVSESMKIDHDLELTDEQLDEIEAMDLRMLSMNITPDGVKKRLEKFLKYGNKNDELELHTPMIENFNAMEQLIPKTLNVQKLKDNNDQEGELNGRIIGGFENVHGIQNPREINCINFGHLIRVHCRIYEKPTAYSCLMYPF